MGLLFAWRPIQSCIGQLGIGKGICLSNGLLLSLVTWGLGKSVCLCLKGGLCSILMMRMCIFSHWVSRERLPALPPT